MEPAVRYSRREGW